MSLKHREIEGLLWQELKQFQGSKVTAVTIAQMKAVTQRVIEPFIPSESTLRNAVETKVEACGDAWQVSFVPKNRKARRMLKRLGFV